MTKTILIVEDNAADMQLLDDLLRTYGYQIIQLTDGSDVLQVAREKKPDLILMDIQLPGRSGLDVTKDIKSDPQLKHIPVIAVTAFALKDDEVRFRKAGCDDYIPKPVMVPALLAALAKHLQ